MKSHDPHVYYSPDSGGWKFWHLRETGKTVDGHPTQYAVQPLGGPFPTREAALQAARTRPRSS